MKKSLSLLLSFFSFLLFFSCSNNLKSSSLVISFNLQNQKNQNVQRTAANQENLNVTVIMYDVENMEDKIENIPDYKIIQNQTVPVKNNSARITFNDITVGTKSIIKAQITRDNEILYKGQSQIFVVSEGKNSITIDLMSCSDNTDVPEHPQNPEEQKNTISVTVQLPNDVSFIIRVVKEDTSINIQIQNLLDVYQIDKVLVDGNPINASSEQYSYSSFVAADVLFITVVIKDERSNYYSKVIQYSVEENKIVGE